MKMKLLPALVAAMVLVPAAVAGHTHVPNPSTYALDVSKSDFGGGPALKSDEMHITIDTEKWMKFSERTVDGDGKTMKYSWSGPQDGTAKPFVGIPGKASFKAADDTSHVEIPGLTIDCTFSLTADKKVATEKCDAKFRGKTFHQTLVYNRTK